ncbi:hypothetical protein CR513_05659, partial [Mucuna pruriens]
MPLGTRRPTMLQDHLPTMSKIHPMGCHRGGTPKALPTRSKNNRALLVFNASSGAGPNTKEDSSAHHQTSRNAAPFVIHRQSLEECLHAIEGGDKYSLEVVDLCLVPGVGLLAEFKTLEFDKYNGSS